MWTISSQALSRYTLYQNFLIVCDIYNKRNIMKVQQLNLQNEIINTFNSVYEASIYIDRKYSYRKITLACNEKIKTAYGYKWCYIESEGSTTRNDMSYIDENIILFMTIGDGYINKKGYLVIQHCEKQKEYLEWKHQILMKNNISTSSIKYKKNNGKNSYFFYTKAYDFIKKIREVLYQNNKKKLNKDILEKITPLGLFIWYMDDGNLTPHKRNNKIHSYELMLNTGLQKNENQILIDYFQAKWGIKFNQYKNKNVYRLCCGTKMARKFLEIIKPYASEIKCMEYKNNMTYNLP